MKHRKKWAGAAIAAFVALGMLGTTVAASAADKSDDEATITISGPSVAGHKFSSVRIAKYTNVVVVDGKVTGFQLITEGNPTFKAALINKIVAIHEADESVSPGDVDSDDTNQYTIQNLDPMHWVAMNWQRSTNDDAWGNAGADNTKLRELADWLESKITLFDSGSGGWELYPTSPEGPAERASIELAVLEGLHFVWDSTDPDPEAKPDPGTNPLAMIVGTAFMVDLDGPDIGGPVALGLDNESTLGVVNVKGDLVTIDKDIVQACYNTKTVDIEEAIGPDGEYVDKLGEDDVQKADGCMLGAPRATPEDEDSWTATTGDVLDFVIRTNVPNYPDTYANPVFEIHDTWTGGLDTPTDIVVKVKGIGGDTLQLTGDYTIKWEDAEASPTRFVITLTNPKNPNVAGKVIEVTYKATVRAGALDGDDAVTYTRDTNTAHVEFTNLWSSDVGGGDTTTETDQDEVDVYTFPLDVRKADLNNRSEFLEAEFLVMDAKERVVGMITTDGQGNPAYITDFWGPGEKTGEEEEEEALGSGEFVAKPDTAVGLAGNAWYEVVEYRAPDDYTAANLEVAKFWVYIAATHSEGDLDAGEPGTVELLEYYFADWTANFDPETTEYESVSVGSPYIDPSFNDERDDNMTVLVLNAKFASDMPSTGGQILLIVGLAGVLGLGGLTFGAVGLRKRKMTAATVQAA